MTDVADAQELIGRTAVDSDGDKVGKIGQVYLDDQTGEPRWVTVSTGLFGTKETFAPLYGSSMNDDDLQLGVSKDLVKDAPNMDADGHLDDSENEALYRHYAGHLGDDSTTTPSYDAQPAADVADDHADLADDHAEQQQPDAQHDDVRDDRADASDVSTDGHDTSGPNTDDAMTRSEEQLHVGTEQVENGRARLRKYVVTEEVTTTVPVSHEEVRVDREPITDANRAAAMSGGDITEEEHEVTLHAEQPVVSKETVPVERVKMSTETVTQDHTVNEEVRKEQIDTPDTDVAAEDQPRR